MGLPEYPVSVGVFPVSEERIAQLTLYCEKAGLPVRVKYTTGDEGRKEVQLDVGEGMSDWELGTAVGILYRGGEHLSMPISEAGFSSRTTRLLEGMVIETLGELVTYTEEHFRARANFGGTALEDVRITLERYGMSLRVRPRGTEPSP